MKRLNARDFGPPTMPDDEFLEANKNGIFGRSLWKLRIQFKSREEFMAHINVISKNGFIDGQKKS